MNELPENVPEEVAEITHQCGCGKPAEECCTPPANPDAASCVDEAPPVTAVETQPDKPPLHVSMDTPIQITLSNDLETEKATSTINLWVLANKLADLVEKHGADKEPGWTLELRVSGTTPDGAPAEEVMAEGPAMEVLQGILDQLLPSPVAASLMFNMLQDMMKSTQIRGCLVTALFEGGQPSAFAMMNHTLGEELTEDDINMLAYQAQTNVDMFRAKMKATGHVFPDESAIVTATGAATKLVQ